MIDARVVSREAAAPQSEAHHVGRTVALYTFPVLRDRQTRELAACERAVFQRGKKKRNPGRFLFREGGGETLFQGRHYVNVHLSHFNVIP